MSGRDRTCAGILAHISSYLDGELAATECDAIERHCRGCESCAAVVAGLRHTVGLCREAGTAPLPEVVRARARESVRKLLADKRSSTG
ncbi:MAG: zf-HC2 domain-containing protein [Acidobacteria bacterium]|nr:zf-HC2 domain-containing protein [Acidobacteriota bacterium]